MTTSTLVLSVLSTIYLFCANLKLLKLFTIKIDILIRHILISINLWLAFTLKCQTVHTTFIVLISQGMACSVDGTNEVLLNSGDHLDHTEYVILKDSNSFLALMSNKGSIHEFKKGKYSLKDLGEVQAGGSNHQINYDTIRNFLKPFQNNSIGVSLCPPYIRTEYPRNKTVSVFRGKITINWNCHYPKKSDSTMNISILDIFDEVLFETKIKNKQSIELDLSTFKQSKEFDENKYGILLIDSSSHLNASLKIGIQILDSLNNDKTIYDYLKNVKSALALPSTNATNNFLMACLLDKNGFYFEALPFYEKAISIAPHVQLFREGLLFLKFGQR